MLCKHAVVNIMNKMKKLNVRTDIRCFIWGHPPFVAFKPNPCKNSLNGRLGSILALIMDPFFPATISRPIFLLGIQFEIKHIRN